MFLAGPQCLSANANHGVHLVYLSAPHSRLDAINGQCTGLSAYAEKRLRDCLSLAAVIAPHRPAAGAGYDSRLPPCCALQGQLSLTLALHSLALLPCARCSSIPNYAVVLLSPSSNMSILLLSTLVTFLFCSALVVADTNNHGVTFLYPTPNLTFNYKDTVNVSYTSNFSSPQLFTFCNPTGSNSVITGIPTRCRAIYAAN